MNWHLIGSTVLVMASIVIGFAIPYTPLNQYELQVAAGIFVVLFLIKRLELFSYPDLRLAESIILAFGTTAIAMSTGGIHSPFYFLIYFTLFIVGLFLHPIASFLTTVTFIVGFLLTLPEESNFISTIPIFSLAFIAPLAIFLGEEYIAHKRERILNGVLKKKFINNQEDALLFLTLEVKQKLKDLHEYIANQRSSPEKTQMIKCVESIEQLVETYAKKQ